MPRNRFGKTYSRDGSYSYREKMEALVKAKRAELDAAQTSRKAGERVVAEAPDDVLDSLIATAQDELEVASLLDDAFEYLELKRQRDSLDAIHGASEAAAFLDPNNPSRTVEQQIGRQLVMDGIMPSHIPADRILGRDVSVNQSGIDGEFKDDSEVRRHVTGTLIGDDLELDRSDVYTEFLSPEGRKEAYQDWLPTAHSERQSGLPFFNRAASEYYGQQALRLRGATPVSNKDRSKATQWHGHQGNPASTIDTDRLIENSSQLTLKDTDLSGDFRYMDESGNLTVGDNQTGNLNPDGSINFNILKASNLRGQSMDQIKAEMVDIAQQLSDKGIKPNLDLILSKMMRSGTLAPLQRGSRGNGTRAGKLTSSGVIMGRENHNDQYRYDKILYPLTEPGALYKDEGYLPESFRMFDTAKTRQNVGRLLQQGGEGINLFQHGRSGDLQMSIPVSQKLTDGYLRDANLNRQFSEGYSF